MKIRYPVLTPIDKEKLHDEIMKAFPDTKNLEIYEDGIKDIVISLVTQNKEGVIRRIIDRHKPDIEVIPEAIQITEKEERKPMSNTSNIDKALIVEQLCGLASEYAVDKVNAKIADFQKCLESFKANAESERKKIEQENQALSKRLEEAENKIKESDQVILGLRALFASKQG